MKFIVSIDTECDYTPNWDISSPMTFRGVMEGIGEILQPLFDERGVRPVYFVSHEVMEDTESRALLKEISGRCELASHLHPGFMPPEKRKDSMAGSKRSEMQFQYSYETEHAKVKNLTELFERSFGFRPVSFRAGRYGIGKHTGRILMELGYAVDSSVTPHIRWKDPFVPNAPDFSTLPEQPYTICWEGNIWQPGDGPLLEIPITVRRWRRHLARFWRPQTKWFRPWYASPEELCEIVDMESMREQKEQKERSLVMMFHNMEVIPGASPYPQTGGDVGRYLDSLCRALDHAAASNAQFVTTAEHAGVPYHEQAR